MRGVGARGPELMEQDSAGGWHLQVSTLNACPFARDHRTQTLTVRIVGLWARQGREHSNAGAWLRGLLHESLRDTRWKASNTPPA